jgi:hypothetical protein
MFCYEDKTSSDKKPFLLMWANTHSRTLGISAGAMALRPLLYVSHRLVFILIRFQQRNCLYPKS